jgi:hypothetical protein
MRPPPTVHETRLASFISAGRFRPRRGLGGRLTALAWVPLALVMAVGFGPAELEAQSSAFRRLSLEPRVGMAFPTGDFGDIDPACPPGSSGCPFPVQVGTETGWRWALRAHFAVTDRWSVVGEFGKASLGCSPTFCGTTEKPGTQGVSLGLRTIAFPLGSMDIWVEGAAVLEQPTIVRVQDREGNQVSSAVPYPWSPGFAAGFGAELDLKGDEVLFFTPGFRFRYVPSDPPDSDPDLASVTATYMLFELGFRVLLGKG